MASAAGIVATGDSRSRFKSTQRLNGFYDRCRCDSVASPPPFKITSVSMASAAGIAATGGRPWLT